MPPKDPIKKAKRTADVVLWTHRGVTSSLVKSRYGHKWPQTTREDTALVTSLPGKTVPGTAALKRHSDLVQDQTATQHHTAPTFVLKLINLDYNT